MLNQLKQNQAPSNSFKSFFTWQTVVCVFVFGVSYALAAYNGNKVTFDSLAYLAAAKNFSQDFVFITHLGNPYVAWPPLFPVVLALGLENIQVYVFLLHLFCGIFTIALWGRILTPYFSDAIFKFLCLLAISLSTPFVMIFVFVWSEPVFMLLLITYIFLIKKYLHEKNYRYLIFAGTVGCVMLLQRHAGIFILMGSFVGFVLLFRQLPGNHLKYLILHFLLSIIGFSIWNIFILLKYDHRAVKELVPYVDIERNLMLFSEEVNKYILPDLFNGAFNVLITSFFLILFIYHTFQAKKPFLFFLLSLLLMYSLIWLIIPAHEDDISRFLSVTIPAFYFFLFLALDQLGLMISRRKVFFMQLFIFLWLLYPLGRLIKNVLQWQDMTAI